MEYILKFRRNNKERYFVCKHKTEPFLMDFITSIFRNTEERYLEIQIEKVYERKELNLND